MTGVPKSNGHKLLPPARQLVIDRIVSGESDAQIRDSLDRAGYPSDLSRQALAYYRALPEVEAAVTQIELEAAQSGMGMRSRRIQTLNEIIQQGRGHILHGHLVTFRDDAGMERTEMQPLSEDAFARVCLIISGAVKMLGALIDGAPAIPFAETVALRLRKADEAAASKKPSDDNGLTRAEINAFRKRATRLMLEQQGKSELEIQEALRGLSSPAPKRKPKDTDNDTSKAN